MRGFPLINSGIVLLTLLAMLVPLIRLTQEPAAAKTSPPEATTNVATTPVTITLRAAHAPDSVTLSHLGKPLMQTNTLEAEFEVPLELPEEGVDLLVEASWPAGTPETALEVTLEPQARERLSQVIWADGQADDILTFVWKP